jgi:hypothetical protein
MTRRAGRNGRLYINLTSGGTAEPVAFLNSWTFNQTSERFDVTAFGDSNKTYVAGLPDASGDFAGFWDDATTQTYLAALEGVARKVYLYPDISNAPGVYWWGTAFFDFSAAGSTGGAITMNGTWSAASAIAKVG